MKRYEKKTVTTEGTYLVEVKCDICGNPIPREGKGTVEEITVHRKEGWAYPEGGSGTYQEFDVCRTCWDDKVLPWFTAQGATASERDWEF